MKKEKSVYGPDNPHPLSSRKTELIWEGKYDEFGNRREVDTAGSWRDSYLHNVISESSRSGLNSFQYLL